MSQSKKPAAASPNKLKLLEFINSRTQLVLLFLLSFICLILFKDFILLKKVYLFKDIGSDSINYQFPWLTAISDAVKNDGVPGWSFSQGMGQNIFPLWLGDFFSDFLAYFDKSRLPYGLAYMEVIKIILSGFVFYRFLKEVKISNFLSLIFALLYAFSGFMMIGGCWTIFSVEALYAAIILYGVERWLQHTKFFWFITGIALLSFLQPFLLFPYSILLGCYVTARYFDLNEGGIKPFAVFVGKTIGIMALGVLISCYQLLPDLLQYIESPRVGGESSFFAKLQKAPMFGVADDWLRFTTVFRSFGSDIIGTGTNFKGWQNYLEAPVFYCGILALVVFPQFFVSLNKRQKRIYGVITVLFCLPIIFPYFRYLFWAFTGDYFRAFSNSIVLLLLIFSARALDFIEKQHKINKIALGVTVLFLLFLLYTPSGQFKNFVNEGLRMSVTVFLFVYAFFAFKMSDSKGISSALKVVFLCLCVFEATYFSYATVNNRDVITKGDLNNKVGYNDYSLDAVNYLKQNDKGFYRINKDFGSGMAIHGSINDAKVQEYKGTSSYHSFNQKNYIKFLGDFGVINVADENSTRWAKGLTDRPLLFSLAAGKYWISKRTDNSVKGMGFDSIGQFGDVKLYKNRYVAPFGITYNKIITESDLKKLSPFQKDVSALKACVVADNDRAIFSALKPLNLADTLTPFSFENYGSNIHELRKDSFEMSKFSNNNIIGKIKVNEPKVLFFSFPYDEGWHAKVNNADAKLYRVNAGLTGLMLNSGESTIELEFEPRLKGKGKLISIFSIITFAGLVGFTTYRKKKISE